MTFRLVLRLGLLIGVAACGARTDAGTLQSAIDRQLSVNAQKYGIAGQAVLILHDGKPIYRGSQGLARREANVPVHPDDIFPAFSLSKLFASVLVMQLVERGQLDLEAPVGHYLPDLPASWRNLKLTEVLNHVSGLPEYFDASATPIVRPIVPPATREAAFQALADKPFLFATGTQTRYTQTNFVLLGAILEARYNMPYRRIVAERIVEPLGLTSTYFGNSHVPPGKLVNSYIGKDHQLMADHAIDWPEYAIVHGELYTTVDDLGAYLNALCAGRLLRRETLQRLWKPYRYKQGGAGWFASGWEYGTSGRYQYVGHDGGTKVRARLMFDESLTKNTYAIVYLTNGSAENVWSRTLVDSVMAIVAPREFRD
jgi:CubicO group peptidase (beta-lactamase class C family)